MHEKIYINKGVVKLEMIEMKCGSGKINIQPQADNFLGLIQSNGIADKKSEAEVIMEALENTTGNNRLRDIVKPGETVCIIISYITRAWQRMNIYLTYIVKELNTAGIPDEYITFLCATGSHRPQTE